MSLVTHERIYLGLSGSIFIASFLFHISRRKNKESQMTRYARRADIIIAAASYAYMFYFIRHYNLILQSIFYLLLGTTLLIYLEGKRKNENDTIHAYFHVFIGIVSGSILLFK
jgi:hypothetical protein